LSYNLNLKKYIIFSGVSMKATETNLNQFLALNDTRFVIPVYQRNYDWTKSHCKQLIDDILTVGDNGNITSHFIGSIVSFKDKIHTSLETKELTIIDGQQRITTITLIYIVIYHLAKKSQDKRQEKRISETYLINAYSEEEKLKLRPAENNEKALKFLIDGDGDQPFGEFSQLIENYEYLKTRINNQNLDVLLKGLNKLIFVEISLDRIHDDPQRIFESLNSTGLELSQADLIRNYILMGLKSKHQEKIYEDYWLPIEQLCTAEHSNASRVSDFIRDYLTIETREIPNKNKVYLEFKRKFPNVEYEKLKTILDKIKRFAVHYNKLMNHKKETERDIKKQLYYIDKMGINVSYPFLLEVYEDYQNQKINKDTFIDVLELVQCFVWRRFVIGLPTNALNKIFMRLHEDIVLSDYLASLQRSLMRRKGNQRFPRDSEIAEALKDKDFYNILSRNRSYFLERLENWNNKELVQIEENPDITIEHIFPQKPGPKWLEELGKDEYDEILEKHLNTIANLTLSGNNGSLGNKPFLEKRDMPEKGYVHSRFFLNRYLAECDKWGLEELEERFKILSERFFNIWKYPGIDIDLETDNEEINIFDAESPTNKKLDYIIFWDQKHRISRVSDLYVYVIKFLFKEQSKTFFTTDLAEKIELTKHKEKLRQPAAINETYYIEANLDSINKFERIKYALTVFDLEEELIIKYAN
jgi:uncharacterized protein with ParB-like and HNH nuclease domain